MNKHRFKNFLSLPVNSDETWQVGMVPMADMLDGVLAEAADEVDLASTMMSKIIRYASATSRSARVEPVQSHV